ncbi:MAG: phenylalanine--tRNA ligase subunit beta [Sulfurospirillaceae bacterium]|nr:phenylalanine--tRNA ligase subunit beta [Sulfurospirillaceae bacterium]MDD3462437.1 phenylalanine--tRNA ligase subunit beta [Sulfurospirillaceae bacterium]
MIVTKEWLNEWIDIEDISTEKIATTLNEIGLEVDGVSSVRVPKNVVVGKVVSCEKHPDADKLNVCLVNIGHNKTEQIVCGAKNVATEQYVPVALVGAVLPNGIQIKEAELRGVKSCGMICSSTELGLPKINDGIMILDDSIGELVLGKELSQYPLINDDIIDIGLTPNRGDCLSVYGVARDLSVPFDSELKTLDEKQEDDNQLGVGRVLNISASEAIEGSFTYKVFDNKSIKAPLLIQLRLGFVGIEETCVLDRLLSYATHSTGVLLRAYTHDCFSVKEDKAKIIINKEDGLDIVFGNKRASIAGIWQDKECKADEKTSRIILEANYTHPDIVSLRSAGKKLQSDKHLYRSQRGSEPDLNFGMEYFVDLLCEKSDVLVYAGSQQVVQDFHEVSINIDQGDIRKMIGEEIPKEKIIKILKKLGFKVNFGFEQEVMNIKVPQFRPDVVNKQDICEEIVRIVGIDNISSKPFVFAEKTKTNTSLENFRKRKYYRHRAVSAGFYETLHFVFDDKKMMQELGLPTVVKGKELANPITNELNTLRASLLPNMLRAVSQNVKFGKKRVALFEIGSVFDEHRNESKNIAFVYSGEVGIAEVLNHGKPHKIGFFEFARKVGDVLGDFEIEPLGNPNSFSSPYESARIIINKKEAGYISRVHIQTEKSLDLPQTYICEMDFSALHYGRKCAKEYSKFPATSRDLSLIIPKDMSFEEIKKYISSIAPNELIKFSAIDTYESEALKDKLSLTIKLHFQSNEKTLEDDDINGMIEALLSGLKKRFDIGIR